MSINLVGSICCPSRSYRKIGHTGKLFIHFIEEGVLENDFSTLQKKKVVNRVLIRHMILQR